MKYLIVASLLAGLTACSSSQKEKSTYVCITPFTPLSGLAFGKDDPNVKDNGDSLSITNPQGSTLTVPKSLCVQVNDAKAD